MKPDKTIGESANILLFFSTLIQTHLRNCQYLCWPIHSSLRPLTCTIGHFFKKVLILSPPHYQVPKVNENATQLLERKLPNEILINVFQEKEKKWNYLTKIYHYRNPNRYFICVFCRNNARLKSSPDPPKHQVLKPGLSVYAGFTLFTLSPNTLHLESILIQAI